VAMMCLTGADVIARYLFNTPIRGAFELTEILLACFVFSALPLTTGLRGHIEVELIDPKSRHIRRALGLLATASGVIVFAVLAYEIFEYAGRMAKYGQTTNSLQIPLAYVGYTAAGFCAVCVAVLVLVRDPRA
ncbi:MAG: TRAP transporter small permease, partial [Albidovulum sp.]|uniref:TRAP transporter small permease n=1 Tax=Albidovulum sp. TaxID=1872424 RepID=UPI003C94CFF1